MPDAHCHPDYNNNRALWVGEFIADTRPDVLINIGDLGDMASLSSYDKGKASFHGRTYKRDVDAVIDFNEKMFSRIKARKKRMPETHFLEGNHENRIARALEFQPQLSGTVDFDDLRLGEYYQNIHRYQGGHPAVAVLGGVAYAHFHVSGIAGKPISGLHHADSLISKRHSSSTVGHSHLADWSTEISGDGRRINGCVVGCFVDYQMDWTGVTQNYWWSGVVVKRNVNQGNYDIQFISIEALKAAYGHLS